MSGRASYKTTLFDRLGPDAADVVKACVWGLAAGTVSLILFGTIGLELLHLPTLLALLFAFFAASALGAAVAVVPLAMANTSEKAVIGLMASGHTTPYTEQYSYQQALVMQGKVDEALASLEAVIAEPNATNDVRIRAAELCAREAKKPERAAELFREVMRHPDCTVNEEVYSANRLVDLLNGVLDQPGRALVELRRLADRYPDSLISERALIALRTLKALAVERDQPVS